MTTQTTTTTPARTSSRGRTIFLTATGVVVGAGLAAGLVLGLGGGSGSADAPAPTPTTSTSTGTTGHHSPGGGSSSNSGHNTPAAPSAAIETLQRELGQLNYYEGPVDGIMGPQTIAVIKDLQRQAGLPQTGTMNPATQAALASYLAHGNNQMAG